MYNWYEDTSKENTIYGSGSAIPNKWIKITQCYDDGTMLMTDVKKK